MSAASPFSASHWNRRWRNTGNGTCRECPDVHLLSKVDAIVYFDGRSRAQKRKSLLLHAGLTTLCLDTEICISGIRPYIEYFTSLTHSIMIQSLEKCIVYENLDSRWWPWYSPDRRLTLNTEYTREELVSANGHFDGKTHLFIALYYAYAWRVNHVMHINQILWSISPACDNSTYRTEGTDGVVYFWQKFQVLRVFLWRWFFADESVILLRRSRRWSQHDGQSESCHPSATVQSTRYVVSARSQAELFLSCSVHKIVNQRL